VILISGIERSRSAGFTLIEMLVVLVLMGLSMGILLATGVLDRQQDPEDQLQQFALVLQQVSARAVLEGRAQGVELVLEQDAKGQRLLWRKLALEQETWVALDPEDGDMLPQALLADSMQLTLAGAPLMPATFQTVSTDRVALAPQLVFWPTREATPLRLELGTAGQAAAVLEIDLLGRIRVNDNVPPPPLY
jgi:type II secretion system protein H